jgi:ethanolamine utilization microcompartment shell protein EutS
LENPIVSADIAKEAADVGVMVLDLFSKRIFFVPVLNSLSSI